MTSEQGNVTQILLRVRDGDGTAVDALLPLVYQQLRALGGSLFRNQPKDHTLQPTALVHEAYAKLVGAENIEWQSRAHFFAVAAKAMRQILTDHARKNRAAKRSPGEDAQQVTLAELKTPSSFAAIELIALDEALVKLAAWDERLYRIVELRFLGGLTIPESAEVMKISTPTVEREWRMARAWLRRELESDSQGKPNDVSE
ncbi:MAG: sigma-70 family RNA polymerase sigma factor [Phycisphaerae bacterium]